MKRINIAIDGFSACGKSTLAKALARKLFFVYIDTGAMYRAVTLFLQRAGLDLDHTGHVKEALEGVSIRFERLPDGQNHMFLNGEDVEEEIRTLKVSSQVSEVAAISAVRRFLVAQQKEMAQRGGVVMDGRDIGTVVLPDAALKIFLTAEPEVRAARRFLELQAKGQDVNMEQIRHNLAHRDRIDSTRDDSPLRQADDAVVIDNSHLSEQEQLDLVLNLASDRKKQQVSI